MIPGMRIKVLGFECNMCGDGLYYNIHIILGMRQLGRFSRCVLDTDDVSVNYPAVMCV